MWTGFIWLRKPVAGSYDHCNGPSGSVKGDEFVLLSEYSILYGLCSMDLVTALHVSTSEKIFHISRRCRCHDQEICVRRLQ
jgi:hypothetical protein